MKLTVANEASAIIAANLHSIRGTAIIIIITAPASHQRTAAATIGITRRTGSTRKGSPAPPFRSRRRRTIAMQAVADDGVFVFLVGFFVRVFRVGLVDGC
eukprot:scaffold1810_cov60-Cyclotella_meneghiniana.AAC.19